MEITKDHLFEKMLLIRRCEEKLLALFEQGKLRGTTHTSIGQEACSTGVLSAINPEIDVVFSNHRCHGHFLAYGGPLELLYAELMGKKTGACKGIGGSQHLHYENFYTNGIQGGIVPAAVGMAFAEKQKKSGAIVVVFLGDGTLGEGAVYEAFNIASLWKLPVLFVIEANGFAQSTQTGVQLSGTIPGRPKAFGIKTHELKVEDPLTVYQLSKDILQRVRSTKEPECLILYTFRLGPHSKGDDLRSEDILASAQKKDPLNRMISDCPPELLIKLEERIQLSINKAIDFCEKSGELSESEFCEIIGLS